MRVEKVTQRYTHTNCLCLWHIFHDIKFLPASLFIHFWCKQISEMKTPNRKTGCRLELYVSLKGTYEKPLPSWPLATLPTLIRRGQMNFPHMFYWINGRTGSNIQSFQLPFPSFKRWIVLPIFPSVLAAAIFHLALLKTQTISSAKRGVQCMLNHLSFFLLSVKFGWGHL